MRKIFSCMVAFMVCTALGIPLNLHAQENDEPIIVMNSNAKNEAATGFGIVLGTDAESEYYEIDFGFGPEEVEVAPWSMTEEGISGTYIACSPVEQIKIYGDASKLRLFNASGSYLTSVEMSKCTELQIIDLSHNQLQSLDLTPQTKAYAIYLSDNPFTAASPCKIGTPKNDLSILEVDIIEHFDQNFNLSDYPSMQVFDAYHNTDLWKIDPTGCPNLLTLTLEMTNVSSVDVSKNPNLLSLNISETRVANVDISNNTKLEHFLAGHLSGWINSDYYLHDVDLSHNTELTLIDLTNNRLKNVDLSHNTKLTNLNLNLNQLESIDLSANTELYSVNVNSNNMDFATLPIPADSWGEYFYNERPMPVARQLEKGKSLDMSKRVLREGTNTYARVFRMPYDAEPEEIDESLYSYADGVITFNQALADSVYVQYSNTLLTEYDIKTTPFMVKEASEMGQPSKIVSFTLSKDQPSLNLFVGMQGATASAPKTFYIRKNNGQMVECNATAEGIPSAAYVFGEAVKAYDMFDIYIPEGDVMTALKIADTPLSSLDVTKATELTALEATGCELYMIDLAYNRCLRTLDISHNFLSYVDLAGVYGNYEKNVLYDIKASDNKLSTFRIIATEALNYLDLSNNELTEFSLKDFDYIRNLNLSGNKIDGEFSLAYQTLAESIDISGNNITSLVYDSFDYLKNMNVAGNKMTLANLPLLEGVQNYTYAPQQKIQILEQAPAINLTEQNRVINGQGTEFVWKKADGTQLVEGVDINCNEGATRFLKTDLGTVYCEMTNPAFPQFADENALKTTDVEVVGAPTNIVATFTTLNDGNTGEVIFTGSRSTALFIDWRGDGSEYTPYPVETSYISYPGQRTYAGANVKVYTYDEPTDITVFSVNGMALDDIDASAMTNLTTLSINDAGLTPEGIKMPEAANLYELSLSGNAFTEYPYYGKYANLMHLNLSANKLTAFDASKIKTLQTLALANNDISTLTFDNRNLWNLSLEHNAIEEFSTEGLTSLEQLWLSDNKLSHIDLSALRNNLKALSLTDNFFTFATLPLKSDFPNLTNYFCGNQAPVTPSIAGVDGFLRVDLADQAKVGDTATEYFWFLGEPVWDYETGSLTGETLIGEGEEAEYTLADGVTTFLVNDYADKVVCVMTNEQFPGMYLQTIPLGLDPTGVENIITEGENAEGPVNVYTIQGMIVKRNVPRNEALNGLTSGIYIVGNQKILVR